MKHKFKSKRRIKIPKIIIIILIYISFSITYNTLYKQYIKTLSTEKIINKIISSENDKNINLSIYLNLPNQKTKEYTYIFKRGINIKHAKKYTVTYKIKYLFTV